MWVSRNANGADVIGVSWGYHPVEALHEAGATRIVDSFAALRTVLSQRIAPGCLASHGAIPI